MKNNSPAVIVKSPDTTNGEKLPLPVVTILLVPEGLLIITFPYLNIPVPTHELIPKPTTFPPASVEIPLPNLKV